MGIRDEYDALVQFERTPTAVNYNLGKILDQLKEFKYVLTLEITFEKTDGSGNIMTKDAFFNSYK